MSLCPINVIESQLKDNLKRQRCQLRVAKMIGITHGFDVLFWDLSPRDGIFVGQTGQARGNCRPTRLDFFGEIGVLYIRQYEFKP